MSFLSFRKVLSLHVFVRMASSPLEVADDEVRAFPPFLDFGPRPTRRVLPLTSDDSELAERFPLFRNPVARDRFVAVLAEAMVSDRQHQPVFSRINSWTDLRSFVVIEEFQDGSDISKAHRFTLRFGHLTVVKCCRNAIGHPANTGGSRRILPRSRVQLRIPITLLDLVRSRRSPFDTCQEQPELRHPIQRIRQLADVRKPSDSSYVHRSPVDRWRVGGVSPQHCPLLFNMHC